MVFNVHTLVLGMHTQIRRTFSPLADILAENYIQVELLVLTNPVSYFILLFFCK